jgi:D-alanyl-D-alanine carboxypeptidase
MNKISTLLYLSVMLVANVVYPQSNNDKYQEVLDNAHKEGLPAIVALIKDAEGNEWRGKSGFTSIENATPLKINQSFRIASISKIVTSIVILQLVDENKLSLSDTISKYLDTETHNKIPNIDSITILHLLSHSSGIYSFTENNNFWKACYFNDGMSRTWQPNELINYIENKKPDSEPLEPYSKKFYSNTNYILLGKIIEKITNNSLSNEFQKRIFSPLKMNDTFLEGYDKGGRKPIDSYIIPNSSFAKSALKKGLLKKINGSEYTNLSDAYKLFNSWAWAAGGISSSINDLSLFLSALKSQQLLSNKTQEVFLRLNSSHDKGISFFGGTGGSDGIQATMMHLMPNNVDIIILINSSGHKEVNLSTIFVELYKVATNT